MTDWLHNRGEMAEQLRTEAERLKLALEAADTGMWEWDPATGEAAWTDRLWELFGIAPHSQPMTYASWRGIVWPEDLPQAEQAIADATRRGLEFTYEFRVRKPDGSLRSLLSRGRPMGGADGRPTGLYHGIMIDITARRQMEDELRAAEARARARALELDAIMEAMPAITFIAHDPECRSMTSSRVALELLRLTPQANTSLSAPDAERPRTFQTFRGDRELRPEELPVQRAAAAGQPIYGAELDLVFSDGDRRTILGNAVPLLDESRRPRGAIGSFIDITARRQVEAALHAQEARNREILEAIPTIIWSARPDGYIEYCNPGWLSFTGMDREQIQGTGWMAALHPDDVEQTGRAWAEACRRGDIYEVEQRLRCHTGEYHWFLTRATPVRDADGSIRQWYGANTDITARKQAEADLMASEVKYRRIVDTASEGIWILDAGGNTTFANKHLAEMLGYEQGEMQGRSLFAFMDEEARLEAEYHLGKRREGLSETHDFRFRRRDGSDLWAIVSTTPILDDQGGYLGALGMITDITDRKRAEAALRESEERFKRMIDEAPLGIAIVDSLNAKFCLVNPALARITGRSREELERIDWVSITHPDDIQPDKENMAAMNAGKIPGFQLEKRYRHPDGRYFWVNITVAPMYVEDSSKLRHLLMVEDISARKRAEDALRESEARFRQIANSLPQLVWTCAPDGQCDFLSRQWVEYTGAPEAEQLGYGWLERLHPEDRERTAAAWAHAVAAGGDLQVAFRIRDKDGAYRWFDTRATRLKDAAGQTVK
jgi:PAS domain S-box-containing protein